MTFEELYEELEWTGIPVTYHSWSDNDSERPGLPFVCYNEVYSNNFFADGTVYKPVKHVQIELYEAARNPDVEGMIEEALKDTPWQNTVNYLDDERCYQIIYEIEVLSYEC